MSQTRLRGTSEFGKETENLENREQEPADEELINKNSRLINFRSINRFKIDLHLATCQYMDEVLIEWSMPNGHHFRSGQKSTNA